MLLNRRSLLASALAPLVPMGRDRDQLLSDLGAELTSLRRRAMVLDAARSDSAGWARWNAAVEDSMLVARRIADTPAHDLVGFAIRIEALVWEWHDDLEDHQLQRLDVLAREMHREGSSAEFGDSILSLLQPSRR